MIIEPIKEHNILNIEFMDRLLEEVAKRIIPTTIKKKLHRPSERKAMLEKYGEKAFLLPDELKFPVINPNTGEVDCKLLYAAYIRAKQHNYTQVAQEAKTRFNNNKCSTKVNIHIKEHHTPYDLVELIDLLELDFVRQEED